MSKSKRTWTAVVAMFSLGILMFWTSTGLCEEITVRMGWLGGPRQWMIGKAKGMYEEGMGVKINWLQFASGASIISALGAGELDITRLGSPPLVAACSRGVPIYQIALEGAINTSERLVAKKGISDLRALEGKSIAFPPGSTGHYALLAALKVHDVNITKMKLLAIKPADMLSAWTRGDIDAAFVWGPFSHLMEAEGGHTLIVTGDLRKNGYIVWNNYTVRKEFADKHPELIVKFLKVFQENMKMYKSDPDKWTKFIADYLQLKPETIGETLTGLDYPTFEEQLTTQWLGDSKTKNESNIAKAMMDIGEFLVQTGDLRKSDLPKSYAPFINTTFMEKVVRGQ